MMLDDIYHTGVPEIVAYVCEEVERQGHDTRYADGLERVGWMIEAWLYALRATRRPLLEDAMEIGRLVERRRNADGWRQEGVRVGQRVCPSPNEVVPRLEQLWLSREDLSALEFYHEFELIHPFVDGNGRTGKVLLNWMNGTLKAPIFPPDDLFGKVIRNP